MKNVPMELLRTFTTVTQLGGFTQAGDLLGRTQPAISLQIKRLETLIGRPVFARQGGNLDLTNAGQVVEEYANKILALNDELLAQMDNTSISGKVRLGIPSEFATTLLPKIVSRFTRAYPNVTLEVNCDLSKHLLSSKEKNKYDLILALHDDPAEAGHHRVKNDDLVWVSNNENLASSVQPLPLIAAPDGCIYRHRATTKLKASGIKWQIVYTIPDLSGIQAAIEAGLGVTVLARSTVPSNLKILKTADVLPELGQLSISLISPTAKSDPATDKIAAYLKASLA